MDILETLSQDLALSHQQLAYLLRTDRSNISKSISRQRSLPLAVATQLVEVYKAWQQMAEEPTTHGTPTEDGKEWAHCLAECHYQLQKLQRTLEPFQQRRNALLKRCRFLKQFMASQYIAAAQKEWADILHKEACSKLKEYSLFALQQMQIKEALLLQEMEMIKARLD